MSSYGDAVLALSPDSFWRLDEASGTTFVDEVGAKDLTLNGSGATLQTPVPFSGLDSGILLTSASWLRIGSALTQIASDQFTVCGWVRQVSGSGITAPVVCASFSGGHTDPYYTFMIAPTASSTRLAIATSSFAPNDQGTAYPGEDGLWHHVAMTYDGIKLRLYLDSVKVVEQTPAGGTGSVANMGSFALNNIPALNGAPYAHDAGYASWAYWHNTALSDSDVENLFEERTPAGSYARAVMDDSPVTWLRMDEPADGPLADSSGNGHPFSQAELGGTRTYDVATPAGFAIRWDTGGGRYSRFSPNRDIDVFSVEFVGLVPDNSNTYAVWLATDGFGIVDGAGYGVGFHNGKFCVAISSVIHDFGSALNDSLFHHLLLTWDGTDFVAYIDGAAETYTPGSGPTALSGQSIGIGKALGSGIYQLASGAAVGDMAFYHSTLSPTRAAAHYSAFVGSTSRNMPVPFIASGTALYTPALTGDEAFLPFIASATSLFAIALTGDQDATLSFIPSSTVLRPIVLTSPQSAAIPFVAAATTLYTMVLFYPPPVLDFVIAALGRPGDSVDLSGVNLSAATSVTFDGVSASFVVNADFSVTAIVPVGATSGPVEITTPAGSDTALYDFTVLAPIPVDPGARRFRQGYRWRFLFADLDCVTVTMPNDLLSQRKIAQVLNAATVIEAAVFPDDFRVNGIWDDGYPRVAQSNRLVFAFRREGGSPPWKIRAAGILMSPEDEGSEDIPTSRFTAYDPWKLLEARPVVNEAGELPDSAGFNYFNAPGSATAIEILNNSINNGPDGGCFIDIGLANGGTFYWDGVIETTPNINFQVQYGTMVADALGQLCDAGNMDIVLTPIYDPIRRPGFTHDLSIEKLAGSTRRDAIFAWDRLSRNLGKIDRMHDGTPGSFFNKVQYHAGQGGFAVPGTGPLVNAASVAAFGSYWSSQFFPNQTNDDALGSAVFALATQALELAKQGRRTLTLYPTPERAPVPFVDYRVGDRVPVYASDALRVTADGLQRIEGIPIEISDDSIETVMALLCSPDFRPAT